MAKRKMPVGFVAPAFLVYTVLLVIPIFMAFYFSFYKWNGFNEMKFLGVENYISLFDDSRLSNAIKNTAVISVVVVIAVNVLGLFLAMLVNTASAKSNIFRTVFFVPFVLSTVAISFVWKSILSYNGVLNGILDALGRPDMVGNWLGKQGPAIICIIVVEIWRTLGYHLMLYLASLQTVPPELYEACTVDGGNRFHKFKSVTLPLIVPGMSVSFLMSIINELRMYDIVKVMTDGGPGYDTETIVYNIVSQGFSNNMVGYSSAISVVLFLAIGAISIFIVSAMYKNEVKM